jgi:signal transduction histidine kinase
LNDYSKDVPPEGREMLERVMRSSKRLALLIEQVLSSSQARLTPGMLATIDLGAFVPAIIEDYPNLRSHRGAIHIRQPLAAVLGTEALLTQCISNLLNNAVKFAAPDRPLKIDVWTERLDRKVRCHIRDHGVGIAAADQARIFDSFVRGTNSEGFEGHGIGLALVKRAALRMGGDVGVNSTPDAGSDFWIELTAPPRAREEM